MDAEHDEHTPEYWREHYRLDRLKIGEKVDVRGGYVKRVTGQHDSYVLHAFDNRQRSRWGTIKQISQDVSYIEAWGVLPPPNSKPW